MERAFISRLRPLLGAIAETMDVYVPRKIAEHYVYGRYDPDSSLEPELNAIRACTPGKEFLFPPRELVATYPVPAAPGEIKPFAVFGLKACDLRSMEVLDCVFREQDYDDLLYAARRENMFTIVSDCPSPGESCFCNALGGKPFAEGGFDLSVAPVADGYVIQSGSPQGRSFLFVHADLFGDVPDALLTERAELREVALRRFSKAHDGFPVGVPLREIVERGYGSGAFDDEARTCVECQACTRVCPTCHCFYLFDTRQKDYFVKMKMWDSCMRVGYAQMAGGTNPRKRLGDRLRHRFMHKFAWFFHRYGVEMCVGCGRCIDAEIGNVDMRRLLSRLNDELPDDGPVAAKARRG